MKIYTKTGDKGQTSLVGGQRVSKCCDRLDSYGTVDELNSHIGVLISLTGNDINKQFLIGVQKTLFVVGGYLATDKSGKCICPDCIITNEMITIIENEIDRIDALLPPLNHFILPGGSTTASYAHVCRTVCRRAERCILRLTENNIAVDENVIKYMNRLSDYFFVLARSETKN